MRVAVVGAGSVGSQTALRLSETGVEVEIFDRFNSPNPWGAHAGESRLLRSVPYLETAPGDREILLASDEAWDLLEQQSRRPILNWCGGLIIADSGSEPFRSANTSAHVEHFGSDSLQKRFPQFSVSGEEGILDRRGGLVDPQHAVLAALELALKNGATLHQRTRITSVRSIAGGVEIEIDGQDRRLFDRVVITTGAFSRDLLPQIPLIARRLLLGWYEPRKVKTHLLENMPSFVWTPAPGEFMYGGPSEDGRTVKVGVDAPLGEVGDALSGRTVSDADTTHARSSVQRYLPWLDHENGRYEMHIDGWSVDGHGVLGELPDSPGVIAAVGWSGHGFKISPVLGEIASDIACSRQPRFDISHLRPDRF